MTVEEIEELCGEKFSGSAREFVKEYLLEMQRRGVNADGRRSLYKALTAKAEGRC
jgi:hypothetical protein